MSSSGPSLTDTVFSRVFANDLSPEDWKLLDKTLQSVHNGMNTTTFSELANRGAIQLWRWFSGSTRGLMMTEILEGDNGRRLNIVGLAGTGYFKCSEHIKAGLIHFATENGCWELVGEVSRPGLMRLYESLGAVPVYTTYSLRIS